MQHILELAKTIKLVIFDVDGVLTDGRLYLCDDGQEIKAFHSHDGLGMRLLMQHGIEVAIITARQSKLVETRMQSLGIKHIYQGAREKLVAFAELKNKTNYGDQEIAYVGDDLPDLPIMQRVALGIAVANADPFVRQQANWVTTRKGGKGAAREVCELILQAQNKLTTIQRSYLEKLSG